MLKKCSVIEFAIQGLKMTRTKIFAMLTDTSLSKIRTLVNQCPIASGSFPQPQLMEKVVSPRASIGPMLKSPTSGGGGATPLNI
jgi:hypothetical protein